MNVWQCQQHRCPAMAWGVGGAIGLRAIGWYVKLRPGALTPAGPMGAANVLIPAGPIVLCPVHRPDGMPCQQLSEKEWEEMKSEGKWEQCGPCRADLQAKAVQTIIEREYKNER